MDHTAKDNQAQCGQPQTSGYIQGIDKPSAPPAPTRATTLPSDAAGRKNFPVATGVLDYFPDALVAIAEVSKKGNDQHNPGQPLHWARQKSTDQDDTIIRHFLERGSLDKDGIRHSAKMCWRALALLQLEIEAEQKRFARGVAKDVRSLTTADMQKAMQEDWKHPEWTPALLPAGCSPGIPLPLSEKQNPARREHISTEAISGAQLKRDGADEEGTYRITTERERY